MFRGLESIGTWSVYQAGSQTVMEVQGRVIAMSDYLKGNADYRSKSPAQLDERKLQAIEDHRQRQPSGVDNWDLGCRLLVIALVLIGGLVLWAIPTTLGLRTINEQIFYAILLLIFIVAIKWW